MHFYGAYRYIAGVLRQRYFTINIITGERNKINPNAYILVSASISLCRARTETLYCICYLASDSVPPISMLLPFNMEIQRILLWGKWRITETCQYGKTDQAKIQTSLLYVLCSLGMKQRWDVAQAWPRMILSPLQSLIVHMVWRHIKLYLGVLTCFFKCSLIRIWVL